MVCHPGTPKVLQETTYLVMQLVSYLCVAPCATPYDVLCFGPTHPEDPFLIMMWLR